MGFTRVGPSPPWVEGSAKIAKMNLEEVTFNPSVLGSNPRGPTTYLPNELLNTVCLGLHSTHFSESVRYARNGSRATAKQRIHRRLMLVL